MSNSNIQQSGQAVDYFALCDKIKPFFINSKNKAQAKQEAELIATHNEPNKGDSQQTGIFKTWARREYNMPYLFALYRANVNSNFTVIELTIYNCGQMQRVIAESIWANNLAKFSAGKQKEAKVILRACIKKLLNITRYDCEHIKALR